jgi:Asp-tRNA(Asn)/Glu-tRNA(Gln) amidotransferase A subunit family amidase
MLTIQTTTAFAFGQNGTITHNPIDPGHTPGGSSSGSGAAVADFQCHIALGTQTVSLVSVQCER